MPRQVWTASEREIVARHISESDRAIADRLAEAGYRRSPRAVEDLRKNLGIKREPQTVWTPERVKLLKRLDAEGFSASQIGQQLGGMSRNAVIGKLHRLGISTAPERKARNIASQRTYPAVAARTANRPPPPTPAARAFQHGAGCQIGAAPKPAHTIKITGPTEHSLNVPMWDDRFRAGCCKYPTSGEDAQVILFCAAPAMAGSPYCESHHVVCNQAGTVQVREVRSGYGFGDKTDLPTPSSRKNPAPDEVDMVVDPDKQRGRFRSVRFAAFGEEAA